MSDRLNTLTVTMIKPKKGSIELTGSGAEIRHLLLFGLKLVNQWPVEDLDQELLGARQCMRHLATCYDFLSETRKPAEGRLLQRAIGFHKNLLGLHSLNETRWQIRPKLHLFLELAAEPGTPSSSWNYREESFGGSVSRQSHRQGGWSNPLAMSTSGLTKFCAKEVCPRLH